MLCTCNAQRSLCNVRSVQYAMCVHRVYSKGARTHVMEIRNQCGCVGYALTQHAGCLNLPVYSSVLPLRCIGWRRKYHTPVWRNIIRGCSNYFNFRLHENVNHFSLVYTVATMLYFNFNYIYTYIVITLASEMFFSWRWVMSSRKLLGWTKYFLSCLISLFLQRHFPLDFYTASSCSWVSCLIISVKWRVFWANYFHKRSCNA